MFCATCIPKDESETRIESVQCSKYNRKQFTKEFNGKNFSATDYCVKNSKGSVNYNVRYRTETILYKDGQRQPHSITLWVMRAKNTKKTC